jgi:hypothetical protein
VKHPNFDLSIASPSLGLCLMSSLPKGESMYIKLVELLLIRWLREKNIINVYLRGRACIEFDFDESLTCRGLNLNLGHLSGSTTIYLVWRIVFVCLIVCR